MHSLCCMTWQENLWSLHWRAVDPSAGDPCFLPSSYSNYCRKLLELNREGRVDHRCLHSDSSTSKTSPEWSRCWFRCRSELGMKSTLPGLLYVILKKKLIIREREIKIVEIKVMGWKNFLKDHPCWCPLNLGFWSTSSGTMWRGSRPYISEVPSTMNSKLITLPLV